MYSTIDGQIIFLLSSSCNIKNTNLLLRHTFAYSDEELQIGRLIRFISKQYIPKLYKDLLTYKKTDLKKHFPNPVKCVAFLKLTIKFSRGSSNINKNHISRSKYCIHFCLKKT